MNGPRLSDRPRRPEALALHPMARRPARVATVAGAVLVAWSAAIHLHLWDEGYRAIPTIGPLFVGQAVGGFVLALAMALSRARVAALAGSVFLAGTAAGLLISAAHGLFGFQEHLDAPYVGMSLTIEIGGAVLLGVTALVSRSRSGSRRH